MQESWGPTCTAFHKLGPEARTRAFEELHTVNWKNDEVAARAVAFALVEHRKSFEEWPSDSKFCRKIMDFVAELGGDKTGDRNYLNFLKRRTDGHSTQVLGNCALYLASVMEAEEAEDLSKQCFSDQLAWLKWTREVLASGEPSPLPASAQASSPKLPPSTPQASAAGPERSPEKTHPAAPDDRAPAASPNAHVFPVSLEGIRTFLDNRIKGRQSDEALHHSLFGDAAGNQVGFLCFRSALKRPKSVVQSFLTILSPERSGIPFWTFAHLYEKADEDKVRAAGGLVITTEKALYLIGPEGWVDREHTRENQSIWKHLNPSSLTLLAFPRGSMNTKIIPGIALTANGDGVPVAGRVALRKTVDTEHDQLVGVVSVSELPARLSELADRGRIKIPKFRGAETMTDADLELARQKWVVEEAREILMAVNNRPKSAFLDAVDKETEELRTHAGWVDEINRLFVAGGKVRFVDEGGADYGFTTHQWFNALDWRQR